MAGSTTGRQPTRRTFVNLLLGGGVIAFVGAALYPLLRYLFPPRLAEAVQNQVVAAKVGELRPNSARIFRFGARPGILLMTPEGEYRAFSAVCTHLSCTVQYRPDLKHIWCACHNGHYDLSGRNIAGPPPRPLEAYRVDVRGDEIVVSKTA